MRECWVCLAPAPQLPSPPGAGLRRQVPGLPQTRHPRRALGCRVKAASGASPRWWRPAPLSGATSAGRRGPDRPAQPRPSRSCGPGAVGKAKAIAARQGRCPAPAPRAAAGRGCFPDSVAGSRARPSGKEAESRRWAGAGPRRAPLRLRSLRPFRTFLPPDVPFGVSRWPLQGALATQATQATGPETAFSVGLDSRRGVGWPRPSGLGRDCKALGVGPGAGRSPVRLKLSLLAGWSRPLFS